MEKGGTGKTVLKQIANQTGVSVSMVSIVLNGRGDEMRISAATQTRAAGMRQASGLHAERVCQKAAQICPRERIQGRRRFLEHGLSG